MRQSGALLCGVGCVVEKVFEPGRAAVAAVYNGPIFSLAQIDVVEGVLVVTGGE